MGWTEIVLGGIGGAVVAGGIGNYTAVRIDRLSAERASAHTHAQERAVARLVSSELLLAHEKVERALGAKRWPLWRQPLPRAAWDHHAQVLASRLTPSVFERLARTYDEMGGWQNRVGLYLAQFPASALMNLGGDLAEERESAEMLDALRKSLEASHRELEAVLPTVSDGD